MLVELSAEELPLEGVEDAEALLTAGFGSKSLTEIDLMEELEIGSLAKSCWSWLGAFKGGGGALTGADGERGVRGGVEAGGGVGGGGANCMQDEKDDWASGEVGVEEFEHEWWFSVWRRKDRASQYDFPQPSALHSYGFLLRCVSMCPFK